MSQIPTPIVIDFETVELLPDGRTIGSTEAYRDNFRVSSCAMTWKTEDGSLQSEYAEGEENARIALEKLVGRRQVPVIAHNIQFEMMVARCRFPEIDIDWAVDTMRLVQNFDNGADKFEFDSLPSWDPLLADEPKRESKAGLGLVKSLKRIFGDDYEDHKKEAYEWIYANVPECKKGRAGAYLDRLPSDILQRYNVSDTEQTYRLYEYLTNHFNSIGYDWRFDHQLYLSSVKLIVDSKIRGIRVEREKLAAYKAEIEAEIEAIGREFRKQMAVGIAAVEADRKAAYINAPKTEKGRDKRRIKADTEEVYNEHIRFNPGSNKQLQALFMDKMGIVPKFFTEKKQPAFRSAVLGQWGEGGLLLQRRRKRGIVLAQVTSLLELSNYDGKWHVDLRAAGTTTGRYVGSK